MRLEPGQVAVIAGGGSGIGLELALACAGRGMTVAIADIQLDAARQAAAIVADRYGAMSVPLVRQVDVSRRDQMGAFADAVFGELGACHLICNNAGVLVLGPVLRATPADWSWVMDVNLFGTVNGIDAFVPRMLASGHPGHVLNTVSLRGLATSKGCGVYAASKFAALAVSETLRMELADDGIGVTALCPWSVDTAILASERNRPGEGGGMSAEEVQRLIDAAPSNNITISAAKAAEIAIEAIERNEFLAMTHPCARDLLKQRFDAVMRAVDNAAHRHPELP